MSEAKDLIKALVNEMPEPSRALEAAGFRLVGAPLGRDMTPPDPKSFAPVTRVQLEQMKEDLVNLLGFVDPSDVKANMESYIDIAAIDRAIRASYRECIAVSMDEDGIFYAAY